MCIVILNHKKRINCRPKVRNVNCLCRRKPWRNQLRHRICNLWGIRDYPWPTVSHGHGHSHGLFKNIGHGHGPWPWPWPWQPWITVVTQDTSHMCSQILIICDINDIVATGQQFSHTQAFTLYTQILYPIRSVRYHLSQIVVSWINP